ncbi:Disulfide-bond oxidoreductase YfcG [Rubrivivax sp. A210]|uniref:glutathione S-transferase family protein n=1 Tax=Rubrivivax sp. A210 TaxID=2772301 RepID=UPI00191891D9|nr:glutathione S-transferase N-terminal domain-containing protein [Rubrivivax sp. A210]CAD5374058.1 Disulfide-bond oxidoreductase YfcG [Rubrivivax sp. A210]
MLKFYYSLAPNPMKVALFLEEAGLPYEAIPVDTRKGEQHAAPFLALNPNAKVPVIVDGEATVFDSSAILLYLAEKTGQFLPENTPKARGELLSWLMFTASGIGPFTGQCVHFRHYAPETVPYAQNRYDFEAWRHWRLLDAHLATRSHMLGERYTLVDMAVWGWARALPFALGEAAWGELPHLKRLFDAINARPAAQRVAALRERHAFKAEMDDEARRAMFPHLDHSKG